MSFSYSRFWSASLWSKPSVSCSPPPPSKRHWTSEPSFTLFYVDVCKSTMPWNSKEEIFRLHSKSSGFSLRCLTPAWSSTAQLPELHPKSWALKVFWGYTLHMIVNNFFPSVCNIISSQGYKLSLYLIHTIYIFLLCILILDLRWTAHLAFFLGHLRDLANPTHRKLNSNMLFP